MGPAQSRAQLKRFRGWGFSVPAIVHMLRDLRILLRLPQERGSSYKPTFFQDSRLSPKPAKR